MGPATPPSVCHHNVLVLLLDATALSKYSFVTCNCIEAVTSTHCMFIFVMHEKACNGFVCFSYHVGC